MSTSLLTLKDALVQAGIQEKEATNVAETLNDFVKSDSGLATAAGVARLEAKIEGLETKIGLTQNLMLGGFVMTIIAVLVEKLIG